MRTEERWLEKIRPRIIKKLTSRLQSDINKIPPSKFIKGEIQSTFIWGDVSTGKTLWATWMLIEEEKRMYLNNIEGDCLFVSVPDLLQRIKNTFNSTETTEADILDYYYNIHLLVLDDLGTIKPTDWVLHVLYSLINYRYENQRKTIITSNNSLNTIATVFGDNRITSRIERMCTVLEKTPYKK